MFKWFKKLQEFDVYLEFGYKYRPVNIQYDALGRPFVNYCDQIFLLKPGGSTLEPGGQRASYNRWVPMSHRAKKIYKAED